MAHIGADGYTAEVVTVPVSGAPTVKFRGGFEPLVVPPGLQRAWNAQNLSNPAGGNPTWIQE